MRMAISTSDDVDLTTQRAVPCTLSFLQVDPFYDWMGMPEDEPGLLLWRLVGRKLNSAAEVPAFLAERLETDHPGFPSKPQL